LQGLVLADARAETILEGPDAAPGLGLWLDLNIGGRRAATVVTAVISAITGIVATVAPIVSLVITTIV
jgi:hypothetical protein